MSRIVLVACLALAVSAVAALPAGSAHTLATKRTVFHDDVAEVARGPDITDVAVSSADGALTFRLTIPTHPVLTDDMRIRIWLDADDDPGTGLSVEGREGYDAFLLVERWELGFGVVGVFHCTASSCVGGGVSTVDFTYGSGATFAFNPVALGLGQVRRVRFSVEATAGIRFDETSRRYDFADVRQDIAPADGTSWTYDTRVALVERFSASPSLPKAGKPFALRVRVVTADTGAVVTRGNVSCACRIAGKPIRARSRRFVGEQAVCIFDIPASARGKAFRSTISVRFTGTNVVRSLSGAVR